MENKCIQCGTTTKNKKYCSVECQHQGYKKPISKRIIIQCLYCNKEFQDTEYRINTLNKKYCSRICKDTHQKEKYIGIGNPAFGREISDEERKNRSQVAKKIWEIDGHKEKMKIGRENSLIKNGYWPGTGEDSNLKRKETCLEKYGVDHNWKNKDIREKCEETTIKKYGKTSLEIATEKLFKTAETSIEKIIKNILNKNKIKFKKSFYIYLNEKEYKIYDFYLPEYNMLIEADGDYWHGNPIYFTTLNEIQVINMNNDKIKNELAIQEGYLLLRFWENHIKNINFEIEFLQTIKHGKKD